ncbi:hypothetical protein O7614_25245 [Micromonospora sp. WMMD961]|uniref:hypothetical protein n=1 Tax=Micromonospora sp. WMMD961 TaxID=3016100 RepID=UPI002417AD6E|nr:hypothetical protein [Micromonospora sp. WMMD961]MDG4782975.1 hypothetical protein [Micromonospora sp. WMMD961]
MTTQMLMSARRISASLIVAMLVLAGATGCTPVIKAVTGLTVDADGRPFAVLSWCADRPPGKVILLAEKRSVSPSPSGTAASQSQPSWLRQRYAVPRAATSPTAVRLEGFPPDPAPEPDEAFRMYGVADDNSFTSHAVSFRFAEVADLRPGSILITEVVDNLDEQRTVSMEEFASLAEDEC